MKNMLTSILTASAMLLGMTPLTGAAELNPPKHNPADYDLIEYGGLYYDIPNYDILGNSQECYRVWGVKDTNATSFTIPEEINGKPVAVSIPSDYAFYECENLENIYVEGEDRNGWYSIDGVLYKDSALACYPRARTGDFTVPENVTTIYRGAFSGATIDKLTIDHSMTIEYVDYCTIREIETKGADNTFTLSCFDHMFGLEKITLDGHFNGLEVEQADDLESLTFTPESTLEGEIRVFKCPKLRELQLAECTAPSTLTVSECDSLETLRFYNGFLGMRSYNTVETEAFGPIPIYTQTVHIDTCLALREMEILATPYVSSYDSVEISYCPALEKVTFHELPQRAVQGDLPDEYYKPITIDGVAGNFRVIGREANKALKNWCAKRGYSFEAFSDAIEMGDVSGDAVVNASDATLILSASAMIGAGDPSPLTTAQENVADVNSDNDVNASDAALILQYSAASGAGSFSGTITSYLAKKA